MYQKIKKTVTDNIEVILVGAVIVLTAVVIRTRPQGVRDVMVLEGGKLLVSG